jgi:hypothetical protein
VLMNSSLEGLGFLSHEFSVNTCEHTCHLSQANRHEDLTLEEEGIARGPDFVKCLWFLLTKLPHEKYPARVIGE